MTRTFASKINKKGFLEFDIDSRWNSGLGNGEWNFEESESTRAIKKIYQENEDYVFHSVVVNPEANKMLSKYVGDHKWIKGETEGSPNYRKARTQNEKDYCLRINYKLLSEYARSLDNLLDFYYGKENYASFSIVKGNPYDIWGSENWPKIYAIKDNGNSSSDFKEIVNKLNEKKSYNFLKKLEYPQNYYTSEIDLLRNKKILPLIVQPNEWKVNSENLRNAINFLSQFTLEHNSHDGCEVD